MANPQIEHGYTRISNELLEAFMHIRIPGEAMQILLTILRMTYGFQKKFDAIALSQFHQKTGIVKPSIVRALKQLELMNLIYKKVNGKITNYGLNKNFTSWKPLTKKLTINKKVNEHLQKSKLSFTKTLPTKEKRNSYKKNQHFASPLQPTTEDKRRISSLCESLSGNGFNAYIFVSKNIKANIPFSVTEDVLVKILKRTSNKTMPKIENLWGYAMEILQRDYTEYNYVQELQRHYALKEQDLKVSFNALMSAKERL
jgi:phage replication O-like protein O